MHAFAMLPATLEKVQFDAENMVFCMTGDAMNVEDVSAEQILLFDLKLITFSKDLFSEQAPTRTISLTQSWCLEGGKLFYYRITGTERDAPGAAEIRNLCAYNLKYNFGLTNTTEYLLEAHTEKTNLRQTASVSERSARLVRLKQYYCKKTGASENRKRPFSFSKKVSLHDEFICHALQVRN